MAGEYEERAPTYLQDVDLLGRLSDYFDALDQHVRAGNGWFIYNTSGARANRLAGFLLGRLNEAGPLVSYYFVPWRDFSLNAYMIQIELQSHPSPDALEERARKEHEIATRISRDTMVKMVASDSLIVMGFRPTHGHELDLLRQAVDRRYQDRRPTIVTTPFHPHQLAEAVRAIAHDPNSWDVLFGRIYERSLIAV